MKEYKHILYNKTDDGIVTITLNRPEVFNAFNREMAYELLDALDDFEDAKDEWFCILTGEGRAFCSGEDLKNINLDLSREEQEYITREALWSYQEIVFQILESKKPIVAALNGTAAGAGLSIALACDERFALCTAGAKLKPGFVALGLVPDAGMIALLERLVGYSEVRRWLKPGFSFNLEDNYLLDSLGHRINASHQEVQEKIIPLENILFSPRDGYLSRLGDVVFKYARNLMESRSLAEFSATKTLLNAGIIDLLENRIFDLELEHQVKLEQGEDFREGLMAFKEKRKPRFNMALRGNDDDRPET